MPKSNRGRGAALLGGLVGLLVGGCARGPGSGDAAPDFALLDVQGKGMRLSDYRGQVVLLSFFAVG